MGFGTFVMMMGLYIMYSAGKMIKWAAYRSCVFQQTNYPTAYGVFTRPS